MTNCKVSTFHCTVQDEGGFTFTTESGSKGPLLKTIKNALCMISIVANLCYSYIVFSSRRPLFRLLVSNRNASNQKCEVDTFPRNLPFRCLERYLGSSFRFSKETLQGDEQDTTDCSTLQQSRRV